MLSKKDRTQKHAYLVVGSMCVSLVFVGCFTSASDGDDLKRRMNESQERITQMEESYGSAQAKVAQLEELIERATHVVTRSSADTGAQVEVLTQQVSAQEGTIAELQNELSRLQQEFQQQQRDYEERMKRMARRAGVDIPLEDSEIPATADALFTAATAAYESRDFSQGRALFRAFVQRHQADARADDAQYFVGQSYMLEDRPATALGELRRVVSDFPQGDALPRALFSMGDAFYRLRACNEARQSLELLIRAHPRAPNISDARSKLRDIQRAPSGYCVAQAAQ